MRAITGAQVDMLTELRTRGTIIVHSKTTLAKWQRLADREFVTVEPYEGAMTIGGKFSMRTVTWKVKITDAGRDQLRDTLPGQETWQENPSS